MAGTILGHCRNAIKPEGRLLIVETVLPAGDTPHLGKLYDMIMLVFPRGQERTEVEYAALFSLDSRALLAGVRQGIVQ